MAHKKKLYFPSTAPKKELCRSLTICEREREKYDNLWIYKCGLTCIQFSSVISLTGIRFHLCMLIRCTNTQTHPDAVCNSSRPVTQPCNEGCKSAPWTAPREGGGFQHRREVDSDSLWHSCCRERTLPHCLPSLPPYEEYWWLNRVIQVVAQLA